MSHCRFLLAEDSGNQEALAAEQKQVVETAGSDHVPELIKKLTAIADEIFEKWDKDQRSGKLLLALTGALPRYRADVSEIRCALATHQNCIDALKIAVIHIEHMAAFIGGKGLGYSFESLGEDMPSIRAAITLASGAKPDAR